MLLAGGATRDAGAGEGSRVEEPDPWRTCFERDRDRILHSTAFRRLAGKTQVFVFPEDHQRTRLTHALEVAQVARPSPRALRLNVALAEAIALGHDCGHGPGGHASEDAFDPFVPAASTTPPWGADVVARAAQPVVERSTASEPHWSRPRRDPRGRGRELGGPHRLRVPRLRGRGAGRDRGPGELPASVAERCGAARSAQLGAFIEAWSRPPLRTGAVGMERGRGRGARRLPGFNYERIYLRDGVRPTRAPPWSTCSARSSSTSPTVPTSWPSPRAATLSTSSRAARRPFAPRLPLRPV